MFEYQWVFTPESESIEGDARYKDFLKRMYLQNIHTSLILKKDKKCLKANYKIK